VAGVSGLENEEEVLRAHLRCNQGTVQRCSFDVDIKLLESLSLICHGKQDLIMISRTKRIKQGISSYVGRFYYKSMRTDQLDIDQQLAPGVNLSVV